MPRWRKLLIVFTSAAVLGWMVYGTVNYLSPPSEEEVRSQLAGVAVAETFRFDSQCQLSMMDEVRQYFDLRGAKAGNDMYITGSILNTPVNLYLVDNVAYQQSNNGEWRVNEVPDFDQALNLFTELDPSLVFEFSNLEGYQYLGVEKVAGSSYFHLVFKPAPGGWVGQYFDNVVYTVWLPRRGKKDDFLVTVSGTMRSDPDTAMKMTISFYDIGADITITAPEI